MREERVPRARKRGNDLHVGLDDVDPGIVEGEISYQHVEENLDFVDRESRPNAGLCGWGVRLGHNNDPATLLTLGPAENVIKLE